jgi:recombination protein RecA
VKRALLNLVKELDKKYRPAGVNKPVVARAKDLSPIVYIPTASPVVSFVLGTGGWPQGKLIEFFGPEGAGKTTMGVMALQDCLKQDQQGRAVAVIDVEHRFNMKWAETLGLDLDQTLVSQPENGEEATDIMVDLCRSGDICAILYDSIGGSPGRKAADSFRERAEIIAEVAKVMGRNIRNMAPSANLRDVTVFYLNQLRADMDGQGKYKRIITPGGHAVKHGMSVRLYIRPGSSKWSVKGKDIEGKSADVSVGFSMKFKTVKNSYGPYPREAWSEFFFAPSSWHEGVGFDVQEDLQRLGLLLGIIKRSGPTYTWGKVKAKGRDPFFKALASQDLFDDLHQEVMNAILDGKKSTMTGKDIGEPEPEFVGPDVSDPEV